MIRRLVSASGLGLLAAHAASPAPAWAATTEQVSVSTTGAQSDQGGINDSLSGDGNLVAFDSYATTLVAGVGGTQHVFLRDRAAGTTAAGDRNTAGELADRFSTHPVLSRDGRHLAFGSFATNLAPGPASRFEAAYVRDLATGTTVRASLKNSGRPIRGEAVRPMAFSADGRFLVLGTRASDITGDPKGRFHVLVRDLQAGRIKPIDTGTGSGRTADGDAGDTVSISVSGRFVAFGSDAADIVAGDTNGKPDVFVRDRRTGTVVRASVGEGGAEGNGYSADGYVSDNGSIVAFTSEASNLVAGDTNGTVDVFVRDLGRGTTERVSVATGGGQSNGFTFVAGMSADGRYVVMDTEATNLVSGDTNGQPDILVRDRVAGTTTRVNVSNAGAQANGYTEEPRISADGRVVSFDSGATNLVANDTNGMRDVFVRILRAGAR